MDVPALLFRPDPVDSASITDSATITNSSITVTRSSIFSQRISPGIGSLSGRFIEAFGRAVIHGVESVTIIRRRLTYIQSICPLSDDSPPQDVHKIYDDLLELSRCDTSLYRS
jgi:hypothetical protein